MLHAIAKKKIEFFEGFGIEVDDIKYTVLVTKFEKYFKEKKNKTILRHRLFNSRQKPGEKKLYFIKKIKRLAS